MADPEGPSSGSQRVLRGGGWNSDPERLRSARRYCDTPWFCINVRGFRLARSSGPAEGEGEGEGEDEGEGEGEGEGPVAETHSADQDENNRISLSELLRVIQFYNSDGFHCEAGTEDGYAPGQGDTSCLPHTSDYNTQNWYINLSELLRLIQFFNSGGYHACPDEDPATEDGYCPGL